MLRVCLLLVSLLLSLFLAACGGQPIPEPVQSKFPQVTLPNTEVRTIKSSATGHDYDIYIRFPEKYSQSAKKYPVLYVLDGQWDFKLLDSIYGGLYYDDFIPEMLIVGITYTGIDPDYERLRAIDYTPKGYIPGSGGAPKFLVFFRDELIPFIDANYRVDPAQRVLMGSSFGGSFTLYAMFAAPELFSGYVAASPAVPYGDWAVVRQEAGYASQHTDLPVRLFLSVGEIEELAQPVKDFMETLRERNYTGLEMETLVIAGERHAGNKPEAFNRGLRFIFQGK